MIKPTQWSCNIDIIDKAVADNKLKDWRSTINQPTGNFFYDPWVIKDEYKGTPWDEILNSLGEVVGEARIICLEPGKTYMAHADIDDRWHLNLTGEHSYLIDLDNLKMFPQVKDGVWGIMDAGRIHVASNYGSIDRNQLVVRKLLTQSTLTNLITVTIEPAYEQYDFRYKFDNIYSPWLNKINKENSLADFSHTGTAVSFKIAQEAKVELDNITTSDFKITYQL